MVGHRAGAAAAAAGASFVTSSTTTNVVEELTTVAWHDERVPGPPAPVHVLAACDCSGSMAGRGIREASEGMEALAAGLKAHGCEDDKLSVWGFNDATEELLPSTPAAGVDAK